MIKVKKQGLTKKVDFVTCWYLVKNPEVYKQKAEKENYIRQLLNEEERAPLLETFDSGLFLFYTSSKRKLTARFDMDRRWDYGIQNNRWQIKSSYPFFSRNGGDWGKQHAGCRENGR